IETETEPRVPAPHLVFPWSNNAAERRVEKPKIFSASRPPQWAGGRRVVEPDSSLLLIKLRFPIFQPCKDFVESWRLTKE
ncbi:MAG TPA: hypothetical protein PKH32_04785, partial [Verrucomicrobiota bacterium]|nr:hypothetical protein [Verrucomicrobiota bacterium]